MVSMSSIFLNPYGVLVFSVGGFFSKALFVVSNISGDNSDFGFSFSQCFGSLISQVSQGSDLSIVVSDFLFQIFDDLIYEKRRSTLVKAV